MVPLWFRVSLMPIIGENIYDIIMIIIINISIKLIKPENSIENSMVARLHYILVPKTTDYYIGHPNRWACTCCRPPKEQHPRRYHYYSICTVHQEETEAEPRVLHQAVCASYLAREFSGERCELCTEINRELPQITEYGRSLDAFHLKEELCLFAHKSNKRAII